VNVPPSNSPIVPQIAVESLYRKMPPLAVED
jgi:hypothetical protein